LACPSPGSPGEKAPSAASVFICNAFSNTRLRYSPITSRTFISLALIHAPSGASFTAAITSSSIRSVSCLIAWRNACGDTFTLLTGPSMADSFR
jgi:hypothetical protein